MGNKSKQTKISTLWSFLVHCSVQRNFPKKFCLGQAMFVTFLIYLKWDVLSFGHFPDKILGSISDQEWT